MFALQWHPLGSTAGGIYYGSRKGCLNAIQMQRTYANSMQDLAQHHPSEPSTMEEWDQFTGHCLTSYTSLLYFLALMADEAEPAPVLTWQFPNHPEAQAEE